MNYKAFYSILLVAAMIISCSQNETLHIGGSSTVLPIISDVAERFNGLNPELRLMVNAGGSGVAINQVAEGKIQIGMISRPLTDEEIARYPNTNFIKHAIARDAVVPVVSKNVFEDGVESLNTEQIRKIYAGEIKNWSEVGGPDREILVIDKERSRGTRHIFMQIIAGNPETDAPGADLVLGANNELQTAITQSRSAIGMLSHAWLNEEILGLSVITENGEEIAPTSENIQNGRFPIIRNMELLTNGQSGPALEFIEYILSEEGQKIIEEAGYARVVQ